MDNNEKILQILEQMNNKIDTIQTETNKRFDKLEAETNKRFDKLEADIKDLRNDTELIKTNQTEHTQLINALISRTDMQRAETDRLNIKLDKIEAKISESSILAG